MGQRKLLLLGCYHPIFLILMKLPLDCLPLNSESVAMQAGKLMLDRLNTLLDFTFKITLATRKFACFLRICEDYKCSMANLELWFVTIVLN